MRRGQGKRHDGLSAIGRRLPAVVLLVLATSLLSPSAVLAYEEHEVKAAFLFNFAIYTSWPEGAPDADEPFVIGVLGPDPFSGYLDRLTDKSIHGRRVVVTYFAAVEDLRPCHILFIALPESDLPDDLLPRIHAANTLTVCDHGHEHRGECAIEYFKEEKRVRFQVDLDALRTAGLEMSSKVLRLARVVGADR